jgi:hypothetical protein
MEYIDYLTLEDLRILAEKRSQYCISLYLPTRRMSKEIRQNPIRLKNLIGKAEEQLLALGIRRQEADAFLEQGRALLGEAPFWQHQSDGLAVFVTPEGIRPFRLPIPFEEVAVVSDRFHLKPLLALFTGDGRYYVLALSQNEVRLFQCTRHSAHEIHVDGMPKDLDDALKYEEFEKQLQFHTRTAGVKAPGRGFQSGVREGRRPAIFHGHGSATNIEKDAILRYFLQIDRSLQKVLYRDKAPLVLAGVEFLFPIYRSVNTYQHLLEEGVEGNPEILKPEEIQRHAWAVVEPHFARAQAEAAALFRQELGTGRATNELEAVVSAAAQGKVDILFVAVGAQRWGMYNPDNGKAHLHACEEPGDEDLLDFAAIQTMLNGGTVFAVRQEEIPGGALVAALFRY